MTVQLEVEQRHENEQVAHVQGWGGRIDTSIDANSAATQMRLALFSSGDVLQEAP